MRIAHFGTFDVENFGDLLFPLIAADRLSGIDADISFVSPVGGPPVWDDCAPTISPATLAAGDQVDALLVGGGNIIHAGHAGVDAYRTDGLTALLAYSRLWLTPSEIAVARGLPLCWNAPGVPEAVSPRAAEPLRWAADAAEYLSVRDQHSLRNLRHAGVDDRAVVVPDSALDVRAVWSDEALADAREGLFQARNRSVPKRTIAFHLKQRYIDGPAESLATRLDEIAQVADATPVLLALGPCHGDDGVARSVGAKMRTEPLIVDRPASLREIVGAIQGAEAYVGSSLHGLITALSFGGRGMVVAHEPEAGGKFSGFLEQFQLADWLIPGWPEVEACVRDLLAAPDAQFGRVASTAAPALDQHWEHIAEALTQGAGARSKRTRRKTPPSLEGVVQEGIDELIAVVAREQERAAFERGRAGDATRKVQEQREAADRKLAEVRQALEQRAAAAVKRQQESETKGKRQTTELVELRDELTQIKSRLEDALVDVARLRSEADMSRGRAEAVEQARAELEAQLHERIGKQEELETALATRADYELQVEERLRALEAERSASIEQAAQVEAQLAESVRSNGQLEADLAARAEQEVELRRRLGELEAALEAGVDREGALAERQSELEGKAAATEQRLAVATADIERRAADVRALTAVLSRREETLQRAVEGQVEASGAVARLEGEIAQARTDLGEATLAHEKLELLEARLDDTLKELSDARRRVNERDTIVARLSDAVEHARGEQRILGDRLRQAEDDAGDAERAHALLEEEIESLNEELVDVHAEAERRSAERAASVVERDRLRGEMAPLREEAKAADRLRTQLETSQRETRDASARAAAVKSEIQGLKASLERETSARSAAEALQSESLERERAVRRRAVEDRDELEERLEATLAALNEARRPGGPASVQSVEAERERVRAELLVERAAREALEEHVAALRAEISQRGSRGPDSEMDSPEGSPPTDADSPGERQAVVGDGPDAAARALFADRYAELCRSTALGQLSERDRALAWPVFMPAEEGAPPPRVSVIVCVHNALDDVRLCLESVAQHLSGDAEVVLVNDGSDAATTAFLEGVARSQPRVRLVRNETAPRGYTVAANLGLRAAAGEYLILLNSDTIVTRGWIERIVACGDDDAGAGIIGPVSNAASHQSVPLVRDGGAWATNPLPEWLTVEGMATAVASASSRERPRVPFLNGFCFAIKREVLDAVGYFDEDTFGDGYCEENDFSLRALKSGFKSVVADDAFVYHAKSRSYSTEGRAERAKRSYGKFIDKHGADTVQPLVDQLESNPPVAELGRRLEAVLQDPASLARATHDRLGDVVRPLFALPGVPPGGSGGSHSIVQEAKGMNGFGVTARIAVPSAAMKTVRDAYPDDGALFVPFGDESQLQELARGANVIVATHSDSVPLVGTLAKDRGDLVTAYYVQDYEPLFWPPGSDKASVAVSSYTSIPEQLLFAKTRWLCNIVSAAHGVSVSRVEPSIDRGLYRPPEAPRPPAPVVVAAMVRPRTPRRQAASTVRLLAHLAAAFGDDLEIVTFGCRQQDLNQLTEDPVLRQAHAGVLSRSAVADLLRRAHIFVDHSVYQAFGRTALEAMACGCVPAVPATGGAWEFAIPDVNAVMCDTTDEVATCAAVRVLVENEAGRMVMAQEAVATASGFSVERSAISIFALFADALRARERVSRNKHLSVRAG